MIQDAPRTKLKIFGKQYSLWNFIPAQNSVFIFTVTLHFTKQKCKEHITSVLAASGSKLLPIRVYMVEPLSTSLNCCVHVETYSLSGQLISAFWMLPGPNLKWRETVHLLSLHLNFRIVFFSLLDHPTQMAFLKTFFRPIYISLFFLTDNFVFYIILFVLT